MWSLRKPVFLLRPQKVRNGKKEPLFHQDICLAHFKIPCSESNQPRRGSKFLFHLQHICLNCSSGPIELDIGNCCMYITILYNILDILKQKIVPIFPHFNSNIILTQFLCANYSSSPTWKPTPISIYVCKLNMWPKWPLRSESVCILLKHQRLLSSLQHTLMMSEKIFPHFGDLNIKFETEESLLDGAFDLVERVRPDWKRSDFKTKPFKVNNRTERLMLLTFWKWHESLKY